MRYHEPALMSVSKWKDLLLAGLTEDDCQWDWTSRGTRSAATVRARVVAKSGGVWAASAGVEAMNLAARELGHESKAPCARSLLQDGASLVPGRGVAELQGPSTLVLALERPFLNLASYVSGVATATRELVEIVRAACPQRTPRVSSTRKTLPGYRDLAVQAVIAGGGHPHRVSLGGGVLIKENHIAAAGGIARAIAGAREAAPHGLKIEIEVTNLGELDQAIEAGAEIILLDNFSPSEVRRAINAVERSKRSARPIIEVSGGLNAGTIGDYAIPGVDVLSVGSLTHSVRAVDLSLLVQRSAKTGK